MSPRSLTGAEPGSFRADLHAWIGRMGYTRAQAAEALGVSVTTLNGWLAGKGCGLETTVRKLMDMLGHG